MACADLVDFQEDPDNGRLLLNPHAYQNVAETFSFEISTAIPDGTYTVVTPFDPVLVVEAGLYLVSWDIHGYVALPPPNLGIPLNGGVMGMLDVNGTPRAGTETMIATINEGQTTVDFPALGQEGTGSGTMIMQLGANSVLRIRGAQEGNGSNVSRIISDDRGRCRITAVRLGH